MSLIYSIGVAGGTGSGKTTFLDSIKQTVGDEGLAYLFLDSYYKDISAIPKDSQGHHNFDHPDAYDLDLLHHHLLDLKKSMPIDCPIYDFRVHRRSLEAIRILPKPVLILEGILAFSDPRVFNLLDLKLFIDVASDVRLIRRIYRDIATRGRTLESITKQYQQTVMPMHLQHVEKLREKADLILPNGAQNPAVIDLIVTKIKSCLNTSHLHA